MIRAFLLAVLLVAAIATGFLWSVKLAVLLLAVITALVAAWIWTASASRSRLNALKDREELTDEDFYTRYYSREGIDPDSVRTALQEIADALDVPAGKLRPADRFDEELAPTAGWEFDDGIGILADLIKRKRSADVDPVRSVNDYVRLTATAKKMRRDSEAH